MENKLKKDNLNNLELSSFLNILEDFEQEKQELRNQKVAVLNILEDFTESQEKLKEKSFELELIASVNKGLTAVSEIKDALNLTEKHLKKIFDYDFLCFIILEEKGGEEFERKIFINKKISKKNADSINSEIIAFLNKSKDFKRDINFGHYNSEFSDNQIVEGLKQEKLYNSLLQIKTGNKLIGLLSLGFFDKSECAESKQNKSVHSILSSLAVTISGINALTKSKHSETSSLITGLVNGVIMLNNSNEVVLINPQAEKYLLANKDGGGFYEFIKNVETAKNITFSKLLVDLKKEDKKVRFTDFKYGDSFFEIYFSSVRDHNDIVLGTAIIIHDITQQKQIDSMKSEFVSVASHQLRTPLTAIRLFVEMLMRGDVGKLNKEQAEYMENVYQSTQRMVGLVNDLLNVTRIESGKLRVEPVETDIHNFISIIIEEIKPIADSKKIKIKFSNTISKKITVKLDQNLFRQVVHNLISNAVRYSADQGGVMINSRVIKNKFEISVKDSGIGIPVEAQKRIFEKFYRADNAIKSVTEGTGLGLYVSRMIVESSGGKIWFESKPDKGTTFFIQMPLSGMKKKQGERGLAIS